MISFFAQLFLAVQARIEAMVPEILFTNLDIGQLEHYAGERPAVSFPCVLIDFTGSSYTEQGALDQWGQCTMQLRLGFSPFSSPHSNAPDLSKQEALKHYEIEQKLFAVLHGWEPVYNAEVLAQPLIRTTVQSEARSDAYRVRIINFTTAFEDVAAMAAITKVEATMIPQAEILFPD